MADDVTLTVRVRDMTRGDFNRLDAQLDNLRRDMTQLAGSSSLAGDRATRLDDSLGSLRDRMQRLHQTGTITTRELTHMKRSMALLSREALDAARSGEITADQYRKLRDQINSSRVTFDSLTRDIDLHSTAMRNSAGDAERQRQAFIRLQMAQTRLQHSAVRLRQADDRLHLAQVRTGAQMNRTSGHADHMGGAFSKMRMKLIATAVAIALTLLPTIGALSPMIFGLAAVGGAAALAFGAMKEEAKKLKPEFEALKKVAEAAVMPGFKKGMQDLKHVLKDLAPVVKLGGNAFGEFVRRTAAAMRSPIFQRALTKNVEMGSKWFLQFARSLGVFTQKFMEFGTKSQPALDAWQKLLGGFFDTGLPGMFKELEKGIGGASKFLEGMAYFINNSFLPGLGKFTAAMMDTFGGTGKELLIFFGDAFLAAMDQVAGGLKAVKPFFDMLEGALRGMNQLMKFVAPHMKDIGLAIASAFLPAGDRIGSVVKWFQRLDQAVRNNRTQVFLVMNAFSEVLFGIVSATLQATPVVIEAFRLMVAAILGALGFIVTGAAEAFSWVPGVGGQLALARDGFNIFADSVNGKLASLSGTANRFADEVLPRLEKGKVTVEITQATRALAAVKKELTDPNLTQERRAKLTADKQVLERVIAQAKQKLMDIAESVAQPQLWLDDANFQSKMRGARGAKVPPKNVWIGGNTNPFWSAVNGIIGSTLGTAWINVEERMQDPLWKATGGIVGFAHGGIRGAATGGVRSRMTWVGEQGPELVDLAPGSRVRSNPDSRRMAAASNGGGGVATIEIKSSGSRVDDMLLEILRKSVRVRGGNVQLVIGGKTVG